MALTPHLTAYESRKRSSERQKNDTAYLHHMCRFVDRPHHQILAGTLTLFPEPENVNGEKKGQNYPPEN